MKHLGNWDAGLDVIGVIWIDHEICSICSNVTEVIAMARDIDDELYAPGYICKDCVIEALED